MNNEAKKLKRETEEKGERSRGRAAGIQEHKQREVRYRGDSSPSG